MQRLAASNWIRRVTSTTSSSTPAPNVDTTDIYELTALAVGTTFGAPTGTPFDGQQLLIRIKDNGTPQAISWNAAYVSSGLATLPTTTAASKTHLVGLIYDSAASKFVCMAVDASGY